MINFDQNGTVTATVDFNYSEVDELLQGDRLNSSDIRRMIEEAAREEGMHMAAQAVGSLARWLGTTKNKHGIACRGIVLNWLYDSLQHDCSLTEIAGQYGLKKQSVGRWVDDFKKEFPQAVIHLKHIRKP